jgi:hypothetical protein
MPRIHDIDVGKQRCYDVVGRLVEKIFTLPNNCDGEIFNRTILRAPMIILWATFVQLVGFLIHFSLCRLWFKWHPPQLKSRRCIHICVSMFWGRKVWRRSEISVQILWLFTEDCPSQNRTPSLISLDYLVQEMGATNGPYERNMQNLERLLKI